MLSSGVPFFTVALGAYPIALLLFLFSMLLHWPQLELVGIGALTVGIFVHGAGLVLRGLHAGTVTITNTYEALIFYSWVIVAAFLTIAVPLRKHREVRALIGLLSSALAFPMIALAASPLFSQELRPIAPILRSHWLALHVSCAILGEGFFAVAFVSSILLLWFDQKRRTGQEPRVSLDLLDNLSYKAIAIGFPIFTLGGLFFGAVWAQHAWGRYWGWDPKETFTLVTWLVYVVYLHLRVGFGWRGRRLAWVAVAGFLLALFTFAGVNYLIRGLHSYK